MFSIESFSWWIFPVTNMKCPSLSLLIDFSLKSILLDIRIATPTCFLGTFDWYIFFPQPFTLRWCLSLRLRCVSCMQQKDGFCFCIHSVSLCPYIDELSPFILRDINGQWFLVSGILVFIADDIMCGFPFFGICCCEIIYICVFVNVANFLGLEFSF